jgi:hypothetical protein
MPENQAEKDRPESLFALNDLYQRVEHPFHPGGQWISRAGVMNDFLG